MDAARFDTLARSLTGAASSRRRLLARVVGTALGAFASALGVAAAGATHFDTCRHVGKPCTGSSQCCSSRCAGRDGNKTCRAHHVGTCTAAKDFCETGAAGCGAECNCYRTTGNANFCASNEEEVCMVCSKDAQCVRALQTDGAACVDVNHGPLCPGCGSGEATTTLCVVPCRA